jgi:hypothetical protein
MGVSSRKLRSLQTMKAMRDRSRSNSESFREFKSTSCEIPKSLVLFPASLPQDESVQLADFGSAPAFSPRFLVHERTLFPSERFA